MVTISEESVMTDYSKRIFEMLVRVLVFRSNQKNLIGKDSQAGQLFEKADAAFKPISAQSTLQASGKNAVRLSSRERTTVRDELRKDLEAVSHTAASMGIKEFFMPRDKGDRAIADVARIFARLYSSSIEITGRSIKYPTARAMFCSYWRF